MLILLTVDDIKRDWHIIGPKLAEAVPSTNGTNITNNLLESILSGDMDCWCMCSIENDVLYIHGYGASADYIDIGTGEKDLLIYAFSSFGGTPESVWKESFFTLAKYAKNLGYRNVVAYTTIDDITNRCKSLGGTVRNFLILPIGE